MTTPLFPIGVGLLPVRLESGATMSLRWNTDVMKTLDGKEQRVGNRSKPQMTYDFSVVLDDAKGRAALSLLAKRAHTAATYRVAMPWEGFEIASSVTTAVTCQPLTLCDWDVTGQPIVIEHPDGTVGESIIASAAGNVITLDDNLSALAVRGARIMPVMACVIAPTTQYARYPVNAGVLRITAYATANKLGDGTVGSGAAVATFDGMSLWDYGIGVAGSVAQPIYAGGKVLDEGFNVGAMAAFARSDAGRDFRVSTTQRIHWQWVKKFLDGVHGSRMKFLAPTGRPDLVAVGDASTGTLTVTSPPTVDAPDYINDWYPSLAHRRVRIVLNSGVAHDRSISSTSDLGGTQALTLNAAVVGSINHVEFLETMRFNDQDVTVAFDAQGFSTTLQATVVQR